MSPVPSLIAERSSPDDETTPAKTAYEALTADTLMSTPCNSEEENCKTTSRHNSGSTLLEMTSACDHKPELQAYWTASRLLPSASKDAICASCPAEAVVGAAVAVDG